MTNIPYQVTELKKSKLRKPDNPYALLLLHILSQSLSDIECYLQKKGTPKERRFGARAIIWLEKGDGIFPYIALAAQGTRFEFEEDTFHAWVLKRIGQFDKKGQSAIVAT